MQQTICLELSKLIYQCINTASCFVRNVKIALTEDQQKAIKNKQTKKHILRYLAVYYFDSKEFSLQHSKAKHTLLFVQ